MEKQGIMVRGPSQGCLSIGHGCGMVCDRIELCSVGLYKVNFMKFPGLALEGIQIVLSVCVQRNKLCSVVISRP